ncbi:unnamed protein product [Chrysoparadoxa australica]
MSLKSLKSLYIGGKWVTARATGPLINPATATQLCTAPFASSDEVDSAVEAAADAFNSWGNTSGKERAVYLRAIAAGVKEAKPELAKIDAINMGKPLPEAEWDIDDVAQCFSYYADLAEELDAKQGSAVTVGDKDYVASLEQSPMGVVAAVVPWNYPLLMASWKVAPALAAGCTVVLKPSELTPLTALELAGIADKAGLPPGVLNVVPGLGAAGAALVTHPRVDKVVTFTGSEATGAKILASLAPNIVPASLELGGKSPAIVFDAAGDALAKVVEWVQFGCFWTNGQICSATSRLLLHKDVYQDFVDLLVQETNKIKMGPPLEEGIKLGPLVSQPQQEKVLGFIQRARDAGATVLCGGGAPEDPELPGHLLSHALPCAPRFYVKPTILANVTADMEVWREEVFGPVLSVMSFETEEEAIGLANDSRYGLAAALFSEDEQLLERARRQLRCGVVWLNCSQPCFCQLPWGGFKRSGIGRDLGEEGFNSYMQTKSVITHRSDAKLGWY